MSERVNGFWFPAVFGAGLLSIFAAHTFEDIVATISNFNDAPKFYSSLNDAEVNFIGTALAMCFTSWSIALALRSRA